MTKQTGKSRQQIVAELIILTVLLVSVIWKFYRLIEFPALKYVLIILCLVGLFWSFRTARFDKKLYGFSALKAGWLPILWFTIPGIIFVALCGMLWGKPLFTRETFLWSLEYMPGVIMQQLLLQLFYNNHFDRLFHDAGEKKCRQRAALSSALIFFIFHFPNPWLSLLVLPAGYFWSWHFRKYLNLPALIISQILLGISTMLFLGEGPLLNLRVGLSAWSRLDTLFN